MRGGGDVPTCTVSEGSRDGAAFLKPEGNKTLLLTDTGVYSRSVPMHRLLLPQLLGYLPFQSYATSTLPMGSLRAWGGGCLQALSFTCVEGVIVGWRVQEVGAGMSR